MHSIITATAQYPYADLAKTGTELWSERDAPQVLEYRWLGPPGVRCEDEAGLFSYESKDGDATALPFPPACFGRDVLGQFRLSRGESSTDPESIARVCAYFIDFFRGLKLPPQGLHEETDARAFTLELVARRLTEDGEAPVDTAVHVMTVLGFSEPESTIAARKVAASPFAIWSWGATRKALDEEARDKELARLKEENAAAEAKARRDAPNKQPSKEVDAIVTRRSVNARPSVLAPAAAPSFVRDGFAYFIFDASSALGLKLPAGQFHAHAGEILPETFVIPLTVGELADCRRFALPLDTVREYRRGKFNAPPITEFRDLRSAEGAWSVRCIGERFAPYAFDILRSTPPMYVGDDGVVRNAGTPSSILLAYLVANYASEVRRDVGWRSLQTLLTPAWEEMHPDRGEVTKRGRTVFVDNQGHEYDSEPEDMLDAYGAPLTVTRTEIPDVYWKRPPLPVTLEQFNALYDQAIAGGPDALIGKDELFTPPPSWFVDEHERKLRPDEWRHVLANLAKSGAPLRLAEEIEPSLRAAGLAQSFGNDEYTRIANIMRKLGREKKQAMIEGRRQWAYVVAGGDAE